MAKRSFALGTNQLVFMSCNGVGRMEIKKTTAQLPPRQSAVLTLLTNRASILVIENSFLAEFVRPG